MSTPHDPLLRREAQALAARLQRKVPAWHDAADLVLPTRLALEQCSGGAAAAYKAEVVRRLTGGRGGRPDLAQAGGTKADGIDEAFAVLKQRIEQ